MPDNLYASVEQIFKHVDNDGLLTGNNAEWAKEAVVKADYVSLDYYVSCGELDQLVKHLEELKEAEFICAGQSECYATFVYCIEAIRNLSPNID